MGIGICELSPFLLLIIIGNGGWTTRKKIIGLERLYLTITSCLKNIDTPDKEN